MIQPIAIGAVAVVAAVLFGRSAYTGTGWASRIVQFLYFRVGSLDEYQKTGQVFGAAVEVFASGGDPVLAPVIARVAPDQVGWFSRRFPTDKGAYHDYLPKYDALFAPYRELDAPRLLEVGVKKGGSLVLWRELFPPGAFIYGIDINPDVPTFRRDAHMKVMVLDSTQASLVQAALGDLSFDIIIDDGLHTPDGQLRTFRNLQTFLKPTGVYVIEDVYEIDATPYQAAGMEVLMIPDKSGQSLAVLYPAASLAPRAV
jgi:hypothetical protein